MRVKEENLHSVNFVSSTMLVLGTEDSERSLGRTLSSKVYGKKASFSCKEPKEKISDSKVDLKSSFSLCLPSPMLSILV